MATNRPTWLPSDQRIADRLDELANPMAADLTNGANPGASNSNGDGIHSAVYNVASSQIGSWPRPTPEAGGLIGQHIGLERQIPTDYVLMGNRPCSYRQATINLAPGQQDPGTGTFNVNDFVIPAGAWFWGTEEGLPFEVRITADLNVRVTADGNTRVVML